MSTACAPENRAAELGRAEGTQPRESELVCFGDPDTGTVCVPIGLWSCDAPENGLFKCLRADFRAPSGGTNWDCQHGEFTISCSTATPDAVGGAGWSCEQQEGQQICRAADAPNGPGSSAGSPTGDDLPGDGFPGGGSVTTEGLPGDVEGSATGGGNWVCLSDEQGTRCTSTHATNVPPGGTSWECLVSEFGLACEGDDAPSIPFGDDGTPGDASGAGEPGDAPGDTPGSDGPDATFPEQDTCYCALKSGKSTLVGQQVATVETRSESHDGKPAVYAQLTLSKDFTDNTYGVNSSPCWGETKKGRHTFKELVGSDAAEMNFYDCDGNHVLGTQIDYLSAASSGSGYASLCVSGGDGQMTRGSADAVLGCQTALDVNLNTHGHVLTEDSPVWDDYKPAAAHPDWIYEVWYGVWVDASVFGDAGLCKVTIDYIHSSPACGGSNSVDVEPCPC